MLVRPCWLALPRCRSFFALLRSCCVDVVLFHRLAVLLHVALDSVFVFAFSIAFSSCLTFLRPDCLALLYRGQVALRDRVDEDSHGGLAA